MFSALMPSVKAGSLYETKSVPFPFLCTVPETAPSRWGSVNNDVHRVIIGTLVNKWLRIGCVWRLSECWWLFLWQWRKHQIKDHSVCFRGLLKDGRATRGSQSDRALHTNSRSKESWNNYDEKWEAWSSFLICEVLGGGRTLKRYPGIWEVKTSDKEHPGESKSSRPSQAFAYEEWSLSSPGLPISHSRGHCLNPAADARITNEETRQKTSHLNLWTKDVPFC